MGQKPIEGSNPSLSAKFEEKTMICTTRTTIRTTKVTGLNRRLTPIHSDAHGRTVLRPFRVRCVLDGLERDSVPPLADPNSPRTMAPCLVRRVTQTH